VAHYIFIAYDSSGDETNRPKENIMSKIQKVLTTGKTHTSPYSKATRGNIDVVLNAVTA
jgi:hypothetical protein